MENIKGDKMCESTVYSTDGTKIMEDVINIRIDGEKIHLIDILNTSNGFGRGYC